MQYTEDELDLMISIVRNHYGIYHTNTPQDLIHTIYTEFNIEVQAIDVLKYCDLVFDEDKYLIYRTWNLI